MNGFKLLIDTNIFIGLEDPGRVAPTAAEMVRKCSEYGVSIFVHEAVFADIARDKNNSRREVSISKLRKFRELRAPKLPPREKLESMFGTLKNGNDEVDVSLVYALHIDAVDFLITEDQGIHNRVKLTRLAGRVLTTADALSWLRNTFDTTPVGLPFVEDKKAYEIDLEDDIFDSLRLGYPDFDRWWKERCVQQHRSCWTVTIEDRLAGIIVRKDETHAEAQTKSVSSKILKICTFKVGPSFRGEKLGELLLKQALWFAQRNRYELVYLTAYPEQQFLIQILEYYGFEHTKSHGDGEMVFEKRILRARVQLKKDDDAFTLARLNYPRFSVDAPVKVFCVPIQGNYHQKLFPEMALALPLPLFPADNLLLTTSGERKPGNTIRKVYLCRARTGALAAGDVLLFYHSKADGLLHSQSLTSVGIVESVSQTSDYEDLTRVTAKRLVFSEADLRAMVANNESPVRAINFLLAGHLYKAVQLDELIGLGVFNQRPPQSICLLPASRFQLLRERLQLGFEI